MPAPEYVVMCRESALIACEGLVGVPTDEAGDLYANLLSALSTSPNGGRSIRLPISDGMHGLLASVNVRPGLVTSVRHYRWVATYRHPEDPTVPDVTVRTYDRPRTRRTFRGPNGRRRWVRTDMHRLTKEELPMAARTTRSRAKSRKPAVEELDELEALEELEDLEDIEEDEPAPKPKRRASRSKAKAQPEPEEDDEDEDDEDLEVEDEDDDEDEEPAPRKRSARRTAKPAAKPAAKKQAAPASKAKAKPAAKRTPPAPRQVPNGKLSVNDLADAAGTSGANVRQWLRRNEWPKDEDLGRYVFTKKEVASIVKQMNA